jgi:hypothetical protein
MSVKQLLKPLIPGRVIRTRDRFLEWRRSQLVRGLLAVTQGRVQSGPFRGTQYLRDGHAESGPKILGTYEAEFGSVVEEIVAGGYAHAVNIGAAEGYYAVGLLSRMAGLRVTAFEALDDERRRMAELAKLNGVEGRLAAHGICDAALLQGSIRDGERTLVLMDIEGGERDVLDPVRIPALRGCDILVELHDCYYPGISDQLRARFESSHHITAVSARPRAGDELPQVPGMSPRQVRFLANELRPAGMGWFWMRAGTVNAR